MGEVQNALTGKRANTLNDALRPDRDSKEDAENKGTETVGQSSTHYNRQCCQAIELI